MHSGKLYRFDNGQFIVDITTNSWERRPTNLWGELVPTGCARIGV